MAHILTVFGTGEGQTEKIADSITEEFRARGHEATTVNVAEIDSELDLDEFDAVLIGASVHYGRQQKSVRKWVKMNRDVLVRTPNGFFQVSGASGAKNDEGLAEATGYLDKFIDDTNWQPDRIALFGGALRFSEYGFLKRALLKFIVRNQEFETDESGDAELTDWESVVSFAGEFAAFVEERLSEAVEAD
ncbi:flavodoxin domain-containing protein [Salinigranum marinum]|uniref:flavodoxin domain-containing protein n=1 Tax=Salinigranum marinum TaxID=1515595 RepID=UPI002989E200|nr:flavodoxin domain-containing protein [Salinigranum marinum]